MSRYTFSGGDANILGGVMGFFDDLFGDGDDDIPNYDEIWEKLKPRVAHLSAPAVRLIKTEDTTGSWLGGRPKADSADFPWPRYQDKPLAFLAQLDLKELAAAHRFDWLPADGCLLFFYEMEAMTWGFDPKDKGSCHVVYVETPAAEIDFPADLSEDYRFLPAFIAARAGGSLPPYDSELLEPLELDDDESEAYAECKDQDWGDEPGHQVGGFPNTVQGGHMQMECQLASNGIYLGDGNGYESPEAQPLKAGAKDWRLLFQMGSDDDLDVMWGDLGLIYFWVREQDAKAGNFDNTWLILQCS